MLTRVVLVLECSSLQKKLKNSLQSADIIVYTLKGGNRLWSKAVNEVCDMFVLSDSLISEPAAVQSLTNLPESPSVVIISGDENPERRAGLIAAGCKVVLSEKLSPDLMAEAISSLIIGREKLLQENFLSSPRLAEPSLKDFVSRSEVMQGFMKLVLKVAGSDTTLLLLGETGVGKERLARAIHAESARSAYPFFAINCGALPETLLDSELFGHEDGAFTGAHRAHRGCFELAHRGTLFLDEITELPYHLQVKLLRVLQEREIRRVGGEKSIKVDVRIMSATNSNIEDNIEQNKFRRDLFYRLSVVTLTVPPLRERTADIPVLAESYLEYLRSTMGMHLKTITPEAIEALCQYQWPGNVREFINVIERGMLISDGEAVTLNDLPAVISRLVPGNDCRADTSGLMSFPHDWGKLPWRDFKGKVFSLAEEWYFSNLLKESGGKVGKAAAFAKVDPRSVNGKMRKHGIVK